MKNLIKSNMCRDEPYHHDVYTIRVVRPLDRFRLCAIWIKDAFACSFTLFLRSCAEKYFIFVLSVFSRFQYHCLRHSRTTYWHFICRFHWKSLGKQIEIHTKFGFWRSFLNRPEWSKLYRIIKDLSKNFPE